VISVSMVAALQMVRDGTATLVSAPARTYVTKSAPVLRRLALTTKMSTLGDRQVRAIVSTAAPDRMGDVVVQAGIDLKHYRANPVVLWQHNADFPVARCVEIGVVRGDLQALVQFPPAGTDTDADRVFSKIKAGLVNATSVGFLPVSSEPIGSTGGRRFTKSELVEFSFVTVPAAPGALILERNLRGRVKPVRPERRRWY
jgi:uncharacterized protein